MNKIKKIITLVSMAYKIFHPHCGSLWVWFIWSTLYSQKDPWEDLQVQLWQFTSYLYIFDKPNYFHLILNPFWRYSMQEFQYFFFYKYLRRCLRRRWSLTASLSYQSCYQQLKTECCFCYWDRTWKIEKIFKYILKDWINCQFEVDRKLHGE